MKGIRRTATFSLVLGLISVIALVPIHLALTDIGHGEGDVSLEWSVVRIGILAIVAFQISALITLVNVIRCSDYRTPSGHDRAV